MTLEELYRSGTEMLKEAGIETPSVDAFYLLEHVAGLNRTKYMMYKDQQVSERNIKQYTDILEKRCTRIPYQYITNRADFAGLTFEVNPSVLIPRLDTEVVFEQTLKHIGPRAYVLDLCTGSGAIGISLKRYRPDIHVVLSDISPEALEIARLNVEHNHMDVASETNAAQRPEDLEYGYDLNFGIRVVESDLFDNMAAEESEVSDEKPMVGKFDLIVSNPPYVTESEYEELMPEVKEHEPKLALTAGEDGLDIYRRIAKDAPGYLKENGTLVLEIGCNQAEAVCLLLRENGFTDINVYKDLAELDRVVIGKKA